MKGPPNETLPGAPRSPCECRRIPPCLQPFQVPPAQRGQAVTAPRRPSRAFLCPTRQLTSLQRQPGRWRASPCTRRQPSTGSGSGGGAGSPWRRCCSRHAREAGCSDCFPALHLGRNGKPPPRLSTRLERRRSAPPCSALYQVGLLTLKTAAKPLAKQFESFVMGHPVARQKVIDVAQARHGARRLVPALAQQPPLLQRPSRCRSRIRPTARAATPLSTPAAACAPPCAPTVAAQAGGWDQPGRGGQERAGVCGGHERGQGAGAGQQGCVRGLPLRGEGLMLAYLLVSLFVDGWVGG